MRCPLILIVSLFATPAITQEAVRFGAWQAFCAPTAGCVLGVKSSEGDTLAFVEPPSNDDRLLMVLTVPIQEGSTMHLSLDDRRFVSLGPADGWRTVESAVGSAIQIAPSIAKEGLAEPLRRRDRLTIRYVTDTGTDRSITFSLNGYADTRGYADEE